jgi:hypothetical protein
MLGQLREIMAAAELDIGKRLVIAQQHVEARHQALDQIAFEQQRLDLGVGDDDLEAAGFRHHALEAVRQPGNVGVIGDAVLEIGRLADVKRVALAVEHAIDAGMAGHGLEGSADDIDAARQPAAGGRRFADFKILRGLVVVAHRIPGPDRGIMLSISWARPRFAVSARILS